MLIGTRSSRARRHLVLLSVGLRYLGDTLKGTASQCCIWSRNVLTSRPPLSRRALGSARRRSARSRQFREGCRYAPRPGSRRSGSSQATHSPEVPPASAGRPPAPLRTEAPEHDIPRTYVLGYAPELMPTGGQPQSTLPGQPFGSSLGGTGGSSEASAESASDAPPAGAVSETISIRHPVSRAANLAFCPSLPMASESW